ncbi:hypothetical protein [Celeribacter baekdonensis]|uniref:hypothetical protein n=1 Tax=Celeribacter baekdonensis TaxID=875171 RepID=UPI0026F18F24|nr:hypothetical protein [Celeribacter baekdonensis]|tara:strand:- start:18395 stop:19162 length:768 start_codon:yes stop_codon:yes gene_type:complete
MTLANLTKSTNLDGEDIQDFKTRLKRQVQQLLPSDKNPIIVSSFGRAGSTLVYNALVDAMAEYRFGYRTRITKALSHDTAWTIAEKNFKEGVIYKSHDFPSQNLSDQGVRAVFLFGSAVEAALSVNLMLETRGKAWVKSHFKHLKRPVNMENLLTHDSLGIYDQAFSWFGCTTSPVLCLNYDALWDNEDFLSDFTGLNVKLPIKIKRAPKDFPKATIKQAEHTYSSIDYALKKLPAAFYASSEYAVMFKNACKYD